MRIAARALGERMAQQPADLGLAGDDARLDELEVLARVLLAPGGGTGRERLQPHRRTGAVTRHAARVARPLGGEHRLDAGLEEVVVERRRRRLLGGGGRGTREDNGEDQQTWHRSLPFVGADEDVLAMLALLGLAGMDG